MGFVRVYKEILEGFFKGALKKVIMWELLCEGVEDKIFFPKWFFLYKKEGLKVSLWCC